MATLFEIAFEDIGLAGKLSRLLMTGILGLLLLSPGMSVGAEIKPEINEALQAADTTLAIDLLKHEIELDKSYHLNYFTLGMIYYNRQDCAGARQQFQMALDKKSKDFESLYYLGLCFLSLGQLDSAQAVMDRGVKKAKKEYKHVFENGSALVMLQLGQYDQAQKSVMRALVDQPDNPSYLINLGDAYYYQKVPSLAITYYKQALEKDTGSTEVYYHWAEACLEMRDYNCAIEKLRVVLTRDSTYANAWMRAGGIYFKAALSTPTHKERLERFRETIGSYKRYLELSQVQPDSSNVRVYFELAMSYLNLFGFEDAVGYFRQVLSIPMEAKDIYFHYGKALWGTKDYVKSGEMLLKHLDWTERQGDEVNSNISEEELYQLLGDSYFYRKPKDYSTALPYYLRSLEIKPNQKRIVENVAIGYHTMKSYLQAIEYYDKRIELGIDSSDSSILKNAGYCALNLANRGGADEEDELDDIGEDQSSVDDVGVDKNYYEEAARYLTGYLDYHVDDTTVIVMVANTYLYQLSDCQEGVKYYQRALQLSPSNCEAKKALGYAYFGGVCTKNYLKAVGYLKDAYQCTVASAGACSDINLVLWIGQCYHLRAAARAEAKEDASDDFRNAFEWYEKCLKCDPNNPEAKKGRDEVFLEFGD
ncbi:MAG: tetratricopeptide repeat protein [bacterium]